MARFVVLEHDWPTRHWDLLLEAGDALKAWRLPAEPLTDVSVEPNFDHRRIYLDYEGPVSGDRGTVTRWDAGTFDWVGPTTIEFRGTRLTGRWSFIDGRLCRSTGCD